MGFFSIISSGRGYLVFLPVFCVSLITEVIVEDSYQNDQYYQDNSWPLSLALLISAIIIHLINIKFYGDDYLERKVGKKDTFFFVAMKYWPVVLLLTATVKFFLGQPQFI